MCLCVYLLFIWNSCISNQTPVRILIICSRDHKNLYISCSSEHCSHDPCPMNPPWKVTKTSLSHSSSQNPLISPVSRYLPTIYSPFPPCSYSSLSSPSYIRSLLTYILCLTKTSLDLESYVLSRTSGPLPDSLLHLIFETQKYASQRFSSIFHLSTTFESLSCHLSWKKSAQNTVGYGQNLTYPLPDEF